MAVCTPDFGHATEATREIQGRPSNGLGSFNLGMDLGIAAEVFLSHMPNSKKVCHYATKKENSLARPIRSRS